MGLFGTSTRKRDDEETPSKLSNEGYRIDDHLARSTITKFSAAPADHDRSKTDIELGETKNRPSNEISRPPNQTHSSTYKVRSSESAPPKLPSFLIIRENADLKGNRAKKFER